MANVYIYDGPVFCYDRLLTDRWVGRTTAFSEDKARSNLLYRFKKENNLMATAKISFPKKMIVE